ncbi:MAG: triose-phosphate isomerase [Deltaproteobacteria bacterium]|nr:triose-phosphate isomerase [Deltaproteobacteria bacterium]
MRTPFIAGNWKMNLAPAEAAELARGIAGAIAGLTGVRVALAPAACALQAVCEALAGSPIAAAAQNCHWEASGAFTGEISPEMIRDLGCRHVIIGHSERRQYFGETDETVNKKIHAAFRAGLEPIVCVGETLEEREAGRTMEVVGRQLDGALAGVAAERATVATLAYEPVWAIGTGRTATPEQAQEVHAFLRARLAERYDRDVADRIAIQYGGSVKPGNAEELLGQPDIDGALVGGASLKVDSFAAILRVAH